MTKIEEKMIAVLIDAKTTLEEAAKILARDWPSLANNIVNQCAIRCGDVIAEALAEKTSVTSEIESMREMIRGLADLLYQTTYKDMGSAKGLRDRFEAVDRARAYLSGPAYDFADPAAAREERNTGSSE